MKNNSFFGSFLFVLVGVILMSLESSIIRSTNTDSLNFAGIFGLAFAASNFLIMLCGGFSGIMHTFILGGRILILAGLVMGLSNLSFFIAVKYSGIALPVLVLSATPVVCAVISKLWLNKKTSTSIFVAAFFVSVGLIFIVGGDIDKISWIGLLASLSCLGFYSMLFVIWTGFSHVSATATAVIGGSLLAFFGIIVSGLNLMSGQNLIFTLFMGFVLTPISRILIRQGSIGLSSAFVGLLVILESVFAPFFAWLFLDEIPSSNTIVGGLIILFSVCANTLWLARR